MNIEKVPIDTVHPDPANARSHPEANLAAIRGSLARFGQVLPILVDSAGVIRGGNGTWAAAKVLGWTEIEVTRADGLAGSELTALALALNRTAELSTWDVEALRASLAGLSADGLKATDLASIGFDSAYIASLQPPAAPASFPEVPQEGPLSHKCPECGYEWNGPTK